MYNGIGLTTPRGSGTSGYVIRNLSTLRNHDAAADRQAAWDSGPPKHREPDQGILEHEKKRKVEVKCLELQIELEDKGVNEDEIEEQVGALRGKLLANLAALAPAPARLKPSDTHGIALAKQAELSKMARAFGTRSDYVEGDAFNREKQEEDKNRRTAERVEKDSRREEEQARIAVQKVKWEAERKEKDRLRRREEDKQRKEREAGRAAAAAPAAPPVRSDYKTGDRRSRSPQRRRDSPPRTRRRFEDDEPRRGRRGSPSPSPPRRRRSGSPPRRERSATPPRRERSRSGSPRRRRGRSTSTGSAMSVSTGRSVSR